MIRILASIVLNGIFVFSAGWLLNGVEVADFQTALIAGVVLGLVNAILKPILSFLAFPITIITLGLFQLVINVGLVLLVANWVTGFTVDGWGWGILFVFLLSILNAVLGFSQSGRRKD